MNEFQVKINNELISVPYRCTARQVSVGKDINYYCKKTRNHNGYKRESALETLLQHKPAPIIAAYCFVALGDYVLPIASLPITASDKMKDLLKIIVAENTLLVNYIECLTISYYNAYYRDSFPTYTHYPPYKFIQTLKR